MPKRPSKRSSSPSVDLPARTRGGQPGNTNALKHGFYSSFYKKKERSLLSSLSPMELQGEIELSRVNNRRLLKSLNDNPGLTYDQLISGIRAISLNSALIASLTRTRLMYSRASLQAQETRQFLNRVLSGLPPDNEPTSGDDPGMTMTGLPE